MNEDIQKDQDPNKTFVARNNTSSLTISQNDCADKGGDKKTRAADLEVQRVQDKVMNESIVVQRKQDALKRVMKSRERQKTTIINGNDNKGERIYKDARRSVDCGSRKNLESTFDLMQGKMMTQTQQSEHAMIDLPLPGAPFYEQHTSIK